MVPALFFVSCLLFGCIAPAAAACSSTAADAPSAADRSKLALNPLGSAACSSACISVKPNTTSSTGGGSSSTWKRPVQQQQRPPSTLQGSTDLATSLSVVVLVHNLMPVPLPPRWALASTATAWAWLAFNRILPWLPQTAPPSHADTTATAASGAAAVTAAAGLSPAATAASAAGGVGGDPSTRWWQHALFVVELLSGNALEAVLLTGLLLLPLLVLRRWLQGGRLWKPVPGLSTEAQAAPAAGSSADGAADAAPAPRRTGRSLDGVSAHPQSAGASAARLAKAMREVGSNAHPSRSSRASAGSSSASSSSSSSSPGSSQRSSITDSMVSPEQSVLQPATPPLLFAVLQDSPLGAPGCNMRLAGPLQPPYQHSSSASHSATNPPQAAARAAVEPGATTKGLPMHPSAGRPPYGSSASSRRSSSDSSSAVVARSVPADSSGQQEGYAAAPAGVCADSSGSNAGQAASLNLGAVGTIRTVSTRGPVQPMYPTRALYNSLLETVVVSCKLAAGSTTITTQARGTTASYAGPSTVGDTAQAGSAAASVEVPLSPAQVSLTAGGHGSSISAQRELRSVVEAAIRQAISASNVAVLSTTVTSFPGCVHVVATVNLTPAALAAAAAAGSRPDASEVDVGVPLAGAAGSGTLASKVAWKGIVQQILVTQQDSAAARGSSSSSSSQGSSLGASPQASSDAARLLAREGLCLKHMLVQDTAGHVQFLWVSSDAAGSSVTADVSPAGVSAHTSSVASESPEPASPTASSSGYNSIRASSSMQQLVSVASGISLSSFALPTDGTEDSSSAPGAASKLLLPQELAAALAAAGCGLRLVVSGNPQEQLTTSTEAESAAGEADPSAQPAHLLADHTLWPCSSSWPTSTQFDLQQLLPTTPGGTPAAALLQQFGPVLTVNLVASASQQQAAGSQDSAQAAAVTVAGAAAATEASAAAPAQEGEQEAAGRTASDRLHEEIARLVRRLGERPEQAATTAGTPAATTASPSEHLLLQLPLLLLPSAACNELCQLQQRMSEELGGDAATAAQQHVLPLINDIAAALSMRSMAAGDAAAAAATAAVPQVALNTEQKHVLKQLLQYMSDQSLDALAATLCSQLGVPDIQHLHVSEGQQGTLTTAAPSASAQHRAGVPEIEAAAADESATAPAGQRTSSSAASSAADGGLAPGAHHAVNSKQAAKALEQASAASEQAAAAQRAAAATESALQLALQQISLLSAAAAQAGRQAADAQAAAASASQRAAAVEDAAERQRALQLIASPAGGPPAAGARGVGIWGLLGGNARAVAAARAAGTALLGGVMRSSEPPLVPQQVSRRDVLLGFSDERLEVQYRRMKALQCRSIDRAAFLMQLFRQVVYVWRIGRLMYVSAGTGLSLVLLCKYEAVVLLPYLMMVLTPDFYLYHRHLLLCLSQIAAALTVGMIATTEVYRNEWSALLQRPGPTLLARPSMMLLWYYLLVPILQQQTLPEQALSCVAQLAHSLLIYVFILKGGASLALVVPLLLAASGVSFTVSFLADAWTRQQAVAGARRSLTGPMTG